ncbi:recombinase family protein, partial [Bradyrhizobium sp.]|uniref:recombinase family protein n=1 Tax=Bradyrhizobium sp. TaxID=376 RepID=UPI003C54F732
MQGGKGWTLIEDPDTAPLVREAVRRVIAGEAANSVVADFNRRGIPAPIDSRRKEPQGTPWRAASMRRMLRSPALLGYAVHQGRTVAGDDGMPVRRGARLIPQHDFDRLQRAMDVLATGPLTRTQTPSLLLGVAFCGRCADPDDSASAARLYRGTRGTWKGPRIAQYTCARASRPAEYEGQCRAPSILAAPLDELAGGLFVMLSGDEEVTEQVWIAGEDHTEEEAQVRAALASVRAEYDRGAYSYPGGQADYDTRVDRLSARLAD